MLSNDALDLSQFDLLNVEEKALSEQALRESLELWKPQPLVNEGITLNQAEVFYEHIANNRRASVKLDSLLYNEAILARSYHPAFPDEVTDNLSLLTKEKLEKTLNEEGQALITPPKGINYELMRTFENYSEVSLSI